MIIDWLKDKAKLDVYFLEGWKKRTKELYNYFQTLSFFHIYREFNKEADKLSKEVLQAHEGRISYYQWDPGEPRPIQYLNIY